MYLAKTRKHGQPTYFLRESILEKEGAGFQEICALGPQPGVWIDYPGGQCLACVPGTVPETGKETPPGQRRQP